MDARLVFDLVGVVSQPITNESLNEHFYQNQAAVNGIRASGATTQLILVEGTAWSGAWSKFEFLRPH